MTYRFSRLAAIVVFGLAAGTLFCSPALAGDSLGDFLRKTFSPQKPVEEPSIAGLTFFKYNLRELKRQPHYVEGLERAISQSAPRECLADAILGEAGRETEPRQRLIADVVKNRTIDPMYPTNVCEVIHQWSKQPGQDKRGRFTYDSCQFTFACEPRTYNREDWVYALKIADEELARHGLSNPHMVGAVNYHANYVKPSWRHKLFVKLQAGVHIFYSRLKYPQTAVAQVRAVPLPAPRPSEAPVALAYGPEMPAEGAQGWLQNPAPAADGPKVAKPLEMPTFDARWAALR